MSTTENQVVEYPESDGQPMGETDFHKYWIKRLYDLLQTHYKGQHVYVGSDLLVYYEKGNPKKFVVPDVFVTFDSDPGPRRTFLIWDEQRVPSVVFEVSSRSTAKKDLVDKPELYARLGVEEYFLFDPEADYLDPPLRGFRLQDGRMVEMTMIDNCLTCHTCRCRLTLNDMFLDLLDMDSNQPWLTTAEIAQRELERVQNQLQSERLSKEQEQLAAGQERSARERERLARLEAEAEIVRLRAEIEKLKKGVRE